MQYRLSTGEHSFTYRGTKLSNFVGSDLKSADSAKII